ELVSKMDDRHLVEVDDGLMEIPKIKMWFDEKDVLFGQAKNTIDFVGVGELWKLGGRSFGS
ncbi:hypothetical protein A2U01_0047715, partial [Trifolium medium]|nr:hypothetical protein [Trifolium medium]